MKRTAQKSATKNTRRKNNTSHRIFIRFVDRFFFLHHSTVTCVFCAESYGSDADFFLSRHSQRRENVFLLCSHKLNSKPPEYAKLLHRTLNITQRNRKNGKNVKSLRLTLHVWCMDLYVQRFARCQKFAILMYLVVSFNDDEMAPTPTTTTSQKTSLSLASRPVQCIRYKKQTVK